MPARTVVSNPPPLNGPNQWPFAVVEFPADILFETGLFSPDIIGRSEIVDPPANPQRKEAA